MMFAFAREIQIHESSMLFAIALTYDQSGIQVESFRFIVVEARPGKLA